MSDTESTLRIINQMRDAGVIGNYAIGGAIGCAFYIEPTTTYDLDIFVPFEIAAGSSLVSLDHIFGYLIPLGYKTKGAKIQIEGSDVDFLPADDELLREALLQAVDAKIGGVQTRVMTAEHLMALALRTGRGKDFIRLEQFFLHKAFNENRLTEILQRHNLIEKWHQFCDKYIRTGE